MGGWRKKSLFQELVVLRFVLFLDKFGVFGFCPFFKQKKKSSGLVCVSHLQKFKG